MLEETPAPVIIADFECPECGLTGDVPYYGVLGGINEMEISNILKEYHSKIAPHCDGRLKITFPIDVWVHIDPDIVYSFTLVIWSNN